MFYNDSNLFKDPKINYPIDNLKLNFNDYIAKCKQLIANTRIDLNDSNLEKIIEANAPFELRPESSNIKYGVLLVHGLFDSPFVMKDIGNQLKNQGLLVRAILLPGHGTVPGALLNVTYHQWLQAIRYGLTTLLREVNQVFLVGFSTGASLLLYHALQESNHIKGLILLSPAIKIRSSLDFMTNWYKIISWAWERAAWYNINPEETLDYVKYRSIPFNAVYQVYRLSRAIKKISHTNSLSCPLFFSLSLEDTTVSSDASINYFTQYAHSNSRLILYSNKNENSFSDQRIIVRNACYPSMHINNLSHNAIPISPNNFHYGKNGDYPYASHIYEDENKIYGDFSTLKLKINNFLFKFKLTSTQYSRLTFNPDFEFLAKSINEFIGMS